MPVRFWEHTFEELIENVAIYAAIDEELGAQPFHKKTVVPITWHPSFATAVWDGGNASFANQVLLELRDDWKCVGSYIDDTINIDRYVRRQGLAEELVLRCMEHRDQIPITKFLSVRGAKLLKRAHRTAFERAKKAGLQIPKEVEAEYLAAHYRTQPQ